ncbi:glycosyltransferase family 2 protein [Cohnella sp. GCM10020058]|uniref:glycosyltransferase family 2 protein n=1 Tax=Cohnella sp. GCM10020058 TaxID=3317330 RepID=UPI003626BE28
MQPKVSMVVPCYNKVNYIGEMLDSVIAQKWDNIELILVNDGSNDGTEGIINQYESKLRARGFDVKIVEQENQGLAVAIRNGLMQVAGDFVCMPDSDDLLHDEYVSAMVNALNQFPNINCVVCDQERTPWELWAYSKNESREIRIISNDQLSILKKFVLKTLSQSVCVMMFRAPLLKKLHIIDNFITSPNSHQEPQIWLPILASEEAILHLNRPLYSYILRDDSLETAVTEIQKIYQYVADRYLIIQNVLRNVLKTTEELDCFLKLANLVKCEMIIARISRNNHLESYREEHIKQFVEVVNDIGLLPNKLTLEIVEDIGFFPVYRYVCDYLVDDARRNNDSLTVIRNTQGRLIAYGAGKISTREFPKLLKYQIVPDMVWDIKAVQNDYFFGIPLEYPDFSSLTKNDTVIILLQYNRDVEETLRKTETNIIYYQDVWSALLISNKEFK